MAWATLLDELVQVGRTPSGGDVFFVKLRTVEIGSVKVPFAARTKPSSSKIGNGRARVIRRCGARR